MNRLSLKKAKKLEQPVFAVAMENAIQIANANVMKDLPLNTVSLLKMNLMKSYPTSNKFFKN